jgi:lipopolysaccharide biosynthesis protein
MKKILNKSTNQTNQTNQTEAIELTVLDLENKSPDAVNVSLEDYLFDSEYYYNTYPDVQLDEWDAKEHYDFIGWTEHRNPSERFNTSEYLKMYSDVKESGVNPLWHYVRHGYLEGREIKLVNKSASYDLSLVREELNQLRIKNKEFEDNDVHVNNALKIESDYLMALLFDTEYYYATYPDIKEANIDAKEHYFNYGWKEYRNPSAFFNISEYFHLNQDIKEAGIEPLTHYLKHGRHEGRKLSVVKQTEDRFMSAYYELNNMHSGNSNAPEYAPKTNSPVVFDENAPRVIAFYLPQFHPFKENDAWWGKGFTEWTNVAKAIPQFEGHYQPRLPSDLGYYDLRLVETMQEQTQLAKEHGVHGFCFHYYWFAGHRLMERPIEQYLVEKEKLDFPFCLCWANENWTRRWDGSEHDILMAQEHSEEDNEAVFYDLLRHFKDPRYITVDGKPVLVIYRPDIIPDISGLTVQLRALAIKEGLPGIHLVGTNAFGFNQHRELGLDGLVEFPPHNIQSECINYKITTLNKDFSGYVFKYDDVVDFSLDRILNMEDTELAASYYPTVMTGWDNSARKPGKGNIFHDATPRKFHHWLSGCYSWSQTAHPQGAQFVFINAWNEWAEGTYLEPDKKYGYAYLNAVRSSINEVLTDAKQLSDFAAKVTAKKQSDSVVLAHVFYEDLVGEICDEIIAAQKHKKLDVAISIPNSFSLSRLKQLVKRLKPVKVVVSENRGRDIWPFIQTLDVIKNLNYKFGLKIHSKKSVHLSEGDKWRKSIFKGLLSHTAIDSALNCFKTDLSIGIVAPKDFMYPLTGDAVIDNYSSLDVLTDLYDCEINENLAFVGGSMFWFSFEMANHLLHEGVNRELFGPELGAIDGTIAHAYERFIVSLADHNSYKLGTYKIDDFYNPY